MCHTNANCKIVLRKLENKFTANRRIDYVKNSFIAMKATVIAAIKLRKRTALF